MKALHSSRHRSEAGVALLISIFVLMLISVMALSLVVSSGTESKLAGNYRSSANVYYAALAGLEEGRGRLLPKNPNYLGDAVLTSLRTNKAEVVYILNPAPGENVTPSGPAGGSGYPDTEFGTEFQGGLGGATITTTNSVSAIAGLPPATYKWVRINAVTEASLKLDVNGDGFQDPNTALYYDFLDQNCNPKPNPTLSVCPPSSAGVQALEITSLAALPDGSQNLMQYVVAPISSSLNFASGGSSGEGFPAALTLLGSSANNAIFTGPNSSQFQVNGNDQCGASSAVYGIGYTNGIISNPNKGSYSGAGNLSPNIVSLNGIPPSMQTPSGLDALVQTITQNADKVLGPAPPAGPAGSFDETSLPGTMSAGNPVTVVINGDFSLGKGAAGFGVLVVTGTFNYDSTASWKGVILVIGQGAVVTNGNGNGSGKSGGEIDGAILVAQTRDPSGKLLPDPNLGSASFVSDPNGGGLGIYYSSCLVKAAQAPFTFKVFSYRQLSQ